MVIIINETLLMETHGKEHQFVRKLETELFLCLIKFMEIGECAQDGRISESVRCVLRSAEAVLFISL